MQHTQCSEHSLLAHIAASQQLQHFPVGSVLGLDLPAESPSSGRSVNINVYVWMKHHAFNKIVFKTLKNMA